MARYTGASCRMCRRENLKLFLKGERCYSDKCSFERRSYAPGQHGQNRFRKMSDYAVQLREKQKVKHMYGMLEGQFRRYFHAADRAKGVTGVNLLTMLECRLRHDRADEVIGQDVGPDFLANECRRFAAQDVHVHDRFDASQIQFMISPRAKQLRQIILRIRLGITERCHDHQRLRAKPALLHTDSQFPNF